MTNGKIQFMSIFSRPVHVTLLSAASGIQALVRPLTHYNSSIIDRLAYGD
jgi:hypothetical protein